MITIQNEQEMNAYQKFFQGMLKKWNVKGPGSLSDEDKKKFFSAVKSGWAKEKKGGGAKKEANQLIDDILDGTHNKMLEVDNNIDKFLNTIK